MQGDFKNLYTLEQLKEFLEAEQRIALYGIGEYGTRLADYLLDTGQSDRIAGIVVTDEADAPKEYRGLPVRKAAAFFREKKAHAVVIAVSLSFRREILEAVDGCAASCACMTDALYFAIGGKLAEGGRIVPYRGIDFCVAGFHKCGTTSVFSALKKMKRIYLPDQKETLFFSWNKDVADPEAFLKRQFFDHILDNQIVGMVEPTFCRHAEEIRRIWGGDVKLVFLMRNPVKALFSEFKMRICKGYGLEEIKAYRERGYYEELFTDFLNLLTEREQKLSVHFAHWLRQFYALFPKEQIKTVFFEELVLNPREGIQDILRFIGSADVYPEDGLPHENKRDFVFLEYAGYQIAKRRRELYWEHSHMQEKADVAKRIEMEAELEAVEAQYDAAKKVYGVRPTAKQIALSSAFLEQDVRELEELTGRNLRKLWQLFGQ